MQAVDEKEGIFYMPSILIPLIRYSDTSIMNRYSSFSTVATTGAVNSSTNRQVRAEHLIDELQEVRDKMDKAKCQFDQQVSKLEQAIKDIKKRKRMYLSPLEHKEQDIVFKLQRIYGVSMNRYERRQQPFPFRRFESTSSQQSQQSLSPIDYDPSLNSENASIDSSEQNLKTDYCQQFEQSLTYIQEITNRKFLSFNNARKRHFMHR